MNLESHLTELRTKHQSLSEMIEQEQRSPGSDDLQISALKRKKLHIKEEIERINARM
ncbi:YdcH family protein [Halovulum sp. GXIMD14793]